MMEICVSAKDLSGGYVNKEVFKNLNMDIPKGKITSLIGANGSGKSTILKSLSRIVSPKSGSVLLDGKDMHTMNTKEIAQELALLAQSSKTPSGIKLEDLVEYGRYPYRGKFSGLTRQDREIIHWAMESTNTLELRNREVNQLSGGQRQRAWIAMALAQKTNILFLDEPTTYLDVSHQLEILKLLRNLNLKESVSIVMVLHDLNHAIMFSDYLIAIKDGEIYKKGSSEEIITCENIKEIFNIESEIIKHPILNIPVCLPY